MHNTKTQFVSDSDNREDENFPQKIDKILSLNKNQKSWIDQTILLLQKEKLLPQITIVQANHGCEKRAIACELTKRLHAGVVHMDDYLYWITNRMFRSCGSNLDDIKVNWLISMSYHYKQHDVIKKSETLRTLIEKYPQLVQAAELLLLQHIATHAVHHKHIVVSGGAELDFLKSFNTEGKNILIDSALDKRALRSIDKEGSLPFPVSVDQKETQLQKWGKHIVSGSVITNNIVDPCSIGFAVDEILQKVFRRKDLVTVRTRFKNF